MEQTGILYGIGVGPGDPELMTLKAINKIRECDIVAIPKSGKSNDGFVAYEIAKQAVSELEQKERIEIPMPMTKDAAVLHESHERAASAVEAQLRKGKDVAFLTLGDPSIYSTYLYLHKRILKRGLDAVIVPGITSFCAVAARLGEGLAESDQPLHIIPASYEGTQEMLEWKGTKVLMKMGRSVGKVKALLDEKGMTDRAKMVQNCGMPSEKVWHTLEDEKPWKEEPGYFSMIVIKEDTSL